MMFWDTQDVLTLADTFHSNPQGPFVVIVHSGHCYVHIDTRGFLHPTPIEAHCLVPAYTSWHAI